MKQTIGGLLIAVTILSACSGSDKNTAEEKEKASYEKTKETLEEKEKKSPVHFISVSTQDKRNLIGQTVIKGTVSSKATVATYKDIELKLYFYSKTGTLLEEDKHTVFETLKPGGNESFKTKYYAPKGTDSVVMKVISAKTE